MTKRQEKILENFIRSEVRRSLKEVKFKGAKVTYSNGISITTSINPQVTDDEIRRYFKIGSKANIGAPNGTDKIVKIIDVEILPEEEF